MSGACFVPLLPRNFHRHRCHEPRYNTKEREKKLMSFFSPWLPVLPSLRTREKTHHDGSFSTRQDWMGKRVRLWEREQRLQERNERRVALDPTDVRVHRRGRLDPAPSNYDGFTAIQERKNHEPVPVVSMGVVPGLHMPTTHPSHPQTRHRINPNQRQAIHEER